MFYTAFFYIFLCPALFQVTQNSWTRFHGYNLFLEVLDVPLLCVKKSKKKSIFSPVDIKGNLSVLAHGGGAYNVLPVMLPALLINSPSPGGPNIQSVLIHHSAVFSCRPLPRRPRHGVSSYFIKATFSLSICHCFFPHCSLL